MKYESADTLLRQLERTKSRYNWEQEERFAENHSYVDEEMMTEMLLNGTDEQIQKLIANGLVKYPQVVAGNKKKSEEYIAVSLIALLSRKSIEAGVSSRNALLLSDLYLGLIGRCATAEDVIKVRDAAILDYVGMVREIKEKQSSNRYVEDCKRYVIQNLNHKISVAGLAKDLGLSPDYLSHLFVEVEGMTLSEYIRDARIRLAKDLLANSSRSIAEIAAFLCYSSQSYFSNVFRDAVGMTPKEYRNRYAAPEF